MPFVSVCVVSRTHAFTEAKLFPQTQRRGLIHQLLEGFGNYGNLSIYILRR